jgi:hypothetical protein
LVQPIGSVSGDPLHVHKRLKSAHGSSICY